MKVAAGREDSLHPGGSAEAPRTFLVVLTGNPNAGKTTVFNALTGLRAKVANYAGVTVERKEGRLRGTPPHRKVTVLDLPGAYSLSPQSLDEAVARDVLLGRLPEVAPPDVVVVVVDASNLERHLYFATQVLELGYRTILALNMTDVALDQGLEVDPERLSEELGVPVVALVASRQVGMDALRTEILRATTVGGVERRGGEGMKLPAALEAEARGLESRLPERPGCPSGWRRVESLLRLTDVRPMEVKAEGGGETVLQPVVAEARGRLEAAGVDWAGVMIEARYAWVAGIQERVLRSGSGLEETLSDRMDKVLTHRVWGPVIFLLLMLLMFQAIFTFAEVPMGWMESGVGWLGGWLTTWLPAGDLRDLLVDGVVGGVGAVVVFLPQILLLFLFISLLEDTGYMARAAFLMDRVMSRVGLHGKSFIPLLSSFACAIPGIMATRTIESPKDRLVTILVAPLMSCSARLPVYAVLIAACLPERTWMGWLKLSAVTMLAMYLLGIGVALLLAWVFKRTLLKGRTPLLVLELPPYKRPGVRVVMRHMLDRSLIFLRRAGTVILVASMVLWVLATYPRQEAPDLEAAARRAAVEAMMDPTEREAALAVLDQEEAGEQLRRSYAGQLGHWVEPVVAPLGFDWKIGIGLVASFAAREVFVSTMSTVYNVGAAEDSEAGHGRLAEAMQAQRRADGTPVYTALTGISLMVFYVFALQCVSTVAVVRRETNSWRWPLLQLMWMTALAWCFSLVTYQVGRLLGF